MFPLLLVSNMENTVGHGWIKTEPVCVLRVFVLSVKGCGLTSRTDVTLTEANLLRIY